MGLKRISGMGRDAILSRLYFFSYIGVEVMGTLRELKIKNVKLKIGEEVLGDFEF